MNITKSHFLTFYIAEKYFWHNGNSLIPTIIHWIYNLCCIIFTIGNLTYLLKSYNSGVQFSDIALNLSWLISLSYGQYIVRAFKSRARTGRAVFDMYDFNQLRYFQNECHRMVHVENLAIKISIGYLLTGVFAALIYLEVENCDQNTKNNVCGLAFPSDLFFDLSQRPYRDFYNIMFIFMISNIAIAFLTSCAALCIMMMYTEICLKLFQKVLKQAQETRDKSIRNHQLVKAYILHNDLKKIGDKIFIEIKWPLLAQYLAMSLIFALILISLLIKFNFLLLAQLTVCIIGTCGSGIFAEKMIRLSEEFRNATFYAVPWDGDVKSAKFLMFMNLNMRNILNVPIGDFSFYTNEKVLLIFQMSYSIVTFYINLTK